MVAIGVEKHMLETTNVKQQTQYVVTEMSWENQTYLPWNKDSTYCL